LLPITGPGRGGKTRLASELALVLRERVAQHERFIDFTPIHDPDWS
jgi:hypothetical protein